MRVTVIKYLNVRVGQPSVNAPCYQYLAPGSEIEVDGQFYRGDQYDGVDTWLKDQNGNYYWSGGVLAQGAGLLGKKILNYNAIVNLPLEIRQTKGKGIKIGVADTGCGKHPALAGKIIKGYNALDRTEGIFNDESYESHGTFICGIIAANPIEKGEMMGVAPDASIIVSKISKQKTFSNNTAILDGVNWLIDQKPDIINCSFDFSPGALRQQFSDCFKRALDNNIILVAAGQDDKGLFGETDMGIYYPSIISGFIAVGSLNAQVFSSAKNPNLNSGIRYVLQDYRFKSIDIYESYDSMSGSSFASAYIAGALALILSYSKNDNPLDVLDRYTENLLTSSQFLEMPVIFKNKNHKL